MGFDPPSARTTSGLLFFSYLYPASLGFFMRPSGSISEWYSVRLGTTGRGTRATERPLITKAVDVNATSDNENIRLANHPLIEQLLTTLRDRTTPPLRFREAVEALGHLLAYEAIRDTPLEIKRIDTPLEPMDAPVMSERITIVPILRAGLGLARGMLSLLPDAQMGHIGMARNEDTLEPESYYEKLPPTIAEGTVLVADPMLATGGSAVAAVDLLKSRGCTSLIFVGVLAAPEGLANLSKAHPDLPIVVAGIDRELNDVGYIVPGLGDAGDRYFGTNG